MSSIEIAIVVLAQLLAAVSTIAVLKADVRWIKKWCHEHKEDDERNFARMERDIRELRADERTA